MPQLPGYAYVLHNVVGNKKIIIQIPVTVRYDTAETFSEYQLVVEPVLSTGRNPVKGPLLNLHPEDMSLEDRENYNWGYSDDDK